MKSPERPRLSIITVTYQAEPYIERTIQSVLAQTCQDFEYIIVDGASKDRTLDIVQTYGARVDQLISEPDQGLYDAMNKGLRMAKGDFVWFLNAGDEIVDEQVVEKLYQLMDDDVDVIYGETYWVDEDGVILGTRSELTPHKLPSDLHWRQMKYGLLVCHQSILVRRQIAPQYIMDNLSADIDWIIRSLKKSRKNVFYDGVVSRYLIGGISKQRQWRSWWDRYKVLRIHFGFIANLLGHSYIIFRKMSS